jgi:murein DD-endopeptidase MepM/ murein hydrolase activator NlpD
MATFPLPFVPRLAWSGPAHGYRYFGAPRPHGRQHAACDLIAPAGTEVFAVDSGTVLHVGAFSISYLPGVHVQQIAIQHTSFIVRYCELRAATPGLRRGSRVKEGQVIGSVGQLTRSAMLHFEMYKGDGVGEFTDRANRMYTYVPAGNYQRRSDLLDPTESLNRWRANVPVSRSRGH